MRMWLIDPRLLCNQHLLGEHVELHMLAGSITRGRSVAGFVATGLIEVHSLYTRHTQLVAEMESRDMNHASPLPQVQLWRAGAVDPARSLMDLTERCTGCAARIRNSGEVRQKEMN
jgi:hypothetical protein